VVFKSRGCWFAAASLVLCVVARAETSLVAVATNFADPALKLEQGFEEQSTHRITLTFGSTGKLYAQVLTGAPFDVYLSADQDRPRKLVDSGFAESGSQFTYAVGQLSLWSGSATSRGDTLRDALTDRSVRVIAIANPDLAPYGAAAVQVLQRLKLWSQIGPKIVMGENIGQAFGLVATGNARLGIIARSQLKSRRGLALGGRRWDVPPELHDPIRQDAALLKRGADNAAAKSFLAYLRSSEARAILNRFGYKTSID